MRLLIGNQITTANKHKLPFFVTGGGHGSDTGFASVKHAVNIDLSKFKENVLDLKANTLTVGPGNSFSAFETKLYKAGKVVRKSRYSLRRVSSGTGASH